MNISLSRARVFNHGTKSIKNNNYYLRYFLNLNDNVSSNRGSFVNIISYS